MVRKNRTLTRKQQLERMPEDFLLCRAFQHNWQIEFAYGARDSQGRMNRNWSRIEADCIRCGMHVRRIYDPQFGLDSSTYTRPTRMIGGVVYHYDIKGSGHVKWKAEARQYAFERVLGPKPRKTNKAPDNVVSITA